jgi:hypothetical protein
VGGGGVEMEVTDEYREKYEPRIKGNSYKWTPAGHDDINRLCDTVDRLTQVIEDAILYLDGPEDKYFRAQKLRDRMNMILLGL